MTTLPPVSDLTYEQARDELVTIVGQLESGTDSLAQAMDLWERGESLAAHCEAFLDAARVRLRAVEEGGGANGEMGES